MNIDGQPEVPGRSTGYRDHVTRAFLIPGWRHVFAFWALATLLFCLSALSAGTTSGAGKSQIVIRGAKSSSHLRLKVKGRTLVVSGYLARSGRGDCRYRRGLAVCSLDGVSRMTIVMGPENDKVEVKEKLPIPLTVHLGKGSDKFIGNGERDTCYSEGSRRNRCHGGGGDDVCITGPRNSDCVGGPGDDLCVHSTGSDGCWGGPGADICRMGPGKDGCHGGAGNDRLYGGSDPDQLYGGPGRDYCDGQAGWGKSHTCERGPGR